MYRYIEDGTVIKQGKFGAHSMLSLFQGNCIDNVWVIHSKNTYLQLPQQLATFTGQFCHKGAATSSSLSCFCLFTNEPKKGRFILCQCVHTQIVTALQNQRRHNSGRMIFKMSIWYTPRTSLIWWMLHMTTTKMFKYPCCMTARMIQSRRFTLFIPAAC